MKPKRPRLQTLKPTLQELAPRIQTLTTINSRKSAGLDLNSPYTHRRWRAMRVRQLEREPLCRFCDAAGKVTPATIADHIEPHRNDPEMFWRGALQSLCAHCHASLKQRQEKQHGQ